ncbi:TPA: hypothetical protein ACP2PU_004672, partial [Escherichia coli]
RLSAILKQRPVAEFCLYRRVIYHCQPLRGCITFIKALQPPLCTTIRPQRDIPRTDTPDFF